MDGRAGVNGFERSNAFSNATGARHRREGLRKDRVREGGESERREGGKEEGKEEGMDGDDRPESREHAGNRPSSSTNSCQSYLQ